MHQLKAKAFLVTLKKFTKFEILKFTPLNERIEKELERQMEAKRRRRQQELDTKARINVPQGERQAAILDSEGKAISVQNAASAAYFKREKEADAIRQQLSSQ